MLFRTLLLAAPLFALAAPAGAQIFGSGYAGGLVPCLDVNVSSANTGWTTLNEGRCYAVTNTTGDTLVLEGLGFWAEQWISPTVDVHVYLPTTSGTPEWLPARTGTLNLDYTQKYRTASFAPLSIANGDTVFVGIDDDVSVRYKFSPYGTTATSYMRTTKWVGSFQSRPCFRLLCWSDFILTAAPLVEIAKPVIYEVDVDDFTTAVLLIGLQKQSWNGLPLPFDLGRFGATGSTLYVDPMVTLPLSRAPGGGLHAQIQIPGRPGLHGVQLHAQALAFIPGINPLGLGTSNGATTTIQR